MTVTRRISQAAAAEHGCMTLAELSAFLKAAVDAEIPMDATLAVRLKGFTGRMSRIETADPREDPTS